MSSDSRPARLSGGVFAVPAILSLAAIGAGYALRNQSIGPALLGSGVVGLIGTFAAWPIAAAVGRLHAVVGSDLAPVHERLQQFSVMLNEISEQQLLSEQAKAVAYREKDRDTLRRAIQEDVAKKDWEGALVLVDEMDNRFGYKQEAERIRTEINQRFDEHIRRQVHQTRAVIERYTSNQQWAAAQREADRVIEQFPTNEDARRLSTGIEQSRQAYKNKLLADFNELLAKKDTDGAIATVKQLDFYLSPEEGAGLQESVRGLFRDKQAQLRDHFTDQVHRGDWAAAYRTGEVIVRDWPNTQMAKEVRDKLESLKQRAQEANGTSVATV